MLQDGQFEVLESVAQIGRQGGQIGQCADRFALRRNRLLN